MGIRINGAVINNIRCIEDSLVSAKNQAELQKQRIEL